MNLTIYIILVTIFIGISYILRNYINGLKDSPREIWFLFLAKLLEYAAYGSSNMAFVLYLSSDCGLGDIQAGSYIGIWSMCMTIFSVFVGSIVDAIGIRKTLIFGIFFLLLGRLIMPFSTDLIFVTILSFFPLAVGNALLGPVLSVGIKKYTQGPSTALAFGLFYTMMNVGFAIGGFIFDKFRAIFGETGQVTLPFLDISLSTYRIIFLSSFFLTIPSLVLILLMNDDTTNSKKVKIITLKNIKSSIQNSSRDTFKIMRTVFREKEFWVYLLLLGILVFIKLVFYHFHYTFPKYGIRVLGEGAKVGNLYGIVNPVLIIFLVPIVTHFTRNVKSYYMLFYGTTLSVISIFLCTINPDFWGFLENSYLESLIFKDWLGLPDDKQNPLLYGILSFVILFSIGEAIWSPRLLQLAAELAPVGKEGTYIALSYLPYFLAKLIAGPLSGYLLATYTPADVTTYPEHSKIWIWIGFMSALSPIGLFLFRNIYMSKAHPNKNPQI